MIAELAAITTAFRAAGRRLYIVGGTVRDLLLGRDTSQLDFYVAFAFWKLVCILEGVYARYLGGALGQRDPAELEPFNQQVLGAAAKAEEMLGRLR